MWKWLLVVVVMTAAVVAAYFYQKQRSGDFAPTAAAEADLSATGGSSLPASDELVCPGFVDALGGVTPLATIQPSQVAEVLVSDNDPVEADQELLRFDDMEAQEAVAAAQTLVNAAQQKLNLAYHNPQRQKLLVQQQQAAVDAMRSNLEVARHRAALQREVTPRPAPPAPPAAPPRPAASPPPNAEKQPASPTKTATANRQPASPTKTDTANRQPASSTKTDTADKQPASSTKTDTAEEKDEDERTEAEKLEIEIADEQVRTAEAALRGEEAKLAALQLVDPNEEVQLAQFEVDQAEGKLRQAETALGRCALRAPRAGTVLRVLIAPGQIAVPGQPVLYFAPQDQRVVRVEIEQAYVNDVAPGCSVSVYDDGNPNQVWPGRVLRLAQWYSRPRAILEETAAFADVRTVECVVAIDGDASALRVGQRVWTRISRASSETESDSANSRTAARY